MARWWGCFLPLTDPAAIPVELKREFVVTLGKAIASQLSSQHVHEDEILDDFKAFKTHRRRQ